MIVNLCNTAGSNLPELHVPSSEEMQVLDASDVRHTDLVSGFRFRADKLKQICTADSLYDVGGMDHDILTIVKPRPNNPVIIRLETLDPTSPCL